MLPKHIQNIIISYKPCKNLLPIPMHFSIFLSNQHVYTLCISILSTYLFLISFNKEMSLSYQNSPPTGRGRFTMSACVATKTTRRGLFSFPPNARRETRGLPHYKVCLRTLLVLTQKSRNTFYILQTSHFCSYLPTLSTAINSVTVDAQAIICL